MPARGANEILTLTLRHGADIRSTNRYGGTALIPACERGLAETARLLLRAGVNPNHVNKLGWTALLEAIILGDGGPKYQATVLELLSFGTNPDVADKDGRSPCGMPASAARTPSSTCCAPSARDGARQWGGGTRRRTRRRACRRGGNSGQPAAQPMQARQGHPAQASASGTGEPKAATTSPPRRSAQRRSQQVGMARP